MVTPESGPPDQRAGRAAPPELPESPPERFQFSLKQLLAVMFVSGLLAGALRQVILLVQEIPPLEQVGWGVTSLFGLGLGGALYCLIRGPLLLLKFSRLGRRWRDIQRHRRELIAWSAARKRERQADDTTDVPPAA